MSGYSAGLTKIRPEKESSKVLQEVQSQNEETNKGLAIKKEIESLEKNKSDLKIEVSDLSDERNRDFKQNTSEINVLKKQKSQLINEVRAISDMLSALKEAKEKGVTNFDEFFRGRESILVNFASAVSKRIDTKAKILVKRTDAVEKEEELITEMTTYSSSLLKEAQDTFSEAFEVMNHSESEAMAAEGRIKVAKWQVEKANEMFKKADDYINNAKLVLADANKRKEKADEYVEKHKSPIDRSVKTLTVWQTKLKAKEEFQEKESLRLFEWERLLKDKEGAIRRLADEVNSWKKE